MSAPFPPSPDPLPTDVPTTGGADDHDNAARARWPDPFDAPEVPPRGTLREYLDNPRAVGDDLAAQIRESLNCQRALAQLRAEEAGEAGEVADANLLAELFAPAPAADLMGSAAATDRFLAHLRAGSGAEAGEPAGTGAGPAAMPSEPASVPALTAAVAKAIGQLWTTAHELEHFDPAEPRRRTTRRTWSPVDVILADGPFRVHHDTLWRAVACSPAELWPGDMLGPDEIVVNLPDGDKYVAHLWLEFPVSESQLYAFVGSVAGRDAENLQVARAALAEGLPLTRAERAGLWLDPDDPEDAETLLERDRLHARAAFLSASADAAAAWWEWHHERMAAAALEDASTRERALRFFLENARLVPALDDGSGTQNPCFAWAGELTELRATLAAGSGETPRPEGLTAFSALVLLPPDAEPDGGCFARWQLQDAPGPLTAVGDGETTFYVLDPASGRWIGFGTASRAAEGEPTVATLLGGAWENFAQVEPGTLVLAFPGVW